MKHLTWNPERPTAEWFELVGNERRRGAYVLDATAVDAVNAALAADRPLLIRGEPGSGKSQLARAAAAELKRTFVAMTIEARTEASDLLYDFDAVSRLARAQILAAVKTEQPPDVEAELAVAKFLRPGPLWWAFAWHEAATLSTPPPQAEGADPQNGVVVLLDEIDKADPSLPNGLLEALGERQFSVPPGRPVRSSAVEPPLVVITTNEERSLPNAFLRRCLVLHLVLPEGDELKAKLTERARAHFPNADAGVLQRAADLLAEDRADARVRQLAPPGCAEYLDLVRAVTTLRQEPTEQLALLERLADFTFKKHTPPVRRPEPRG